jgi:hypothetical protein
VAGIGGAVALGEEPPADLLFAGLLLFAGIALATAKGSGARTARAAEAPEAGGRAALREAGLEPRAPSERS